MKGNHKNAILLHIINGSKLVLGIVTKMMHKNIKTHHILVLNNKQFFKFGTFFHVILFSFMRKIRLKKCQIIELHLKYSMFFKFLINLVYFLFK
jgi:hypothetical protein